MTGDLAPRPPDPRPLGPMPRHREWEDDPKPRTAYRRPGYAGSRNCRGNSTEEQRAKWRADYAAKREHRLKLAREFRERNRELRRWQKRADRRAARDRREGRQ